MITAPHFIVDDERRAALRACARELIARAEAGSKQAHERAHAMLSDHYARQFSVPTPGDHGHDSALDDAAPLLEAWLLDAEEREIDWASHAPPRTGREFIRWFKDISHRHRAWKHPFYREFLADEADVEGLRFYFAQETVLDPRFDDCLALIQIGAPARVKMEIARNYWDELGEGTPARVHSTLFARVLDAIAVDPAYVAATVRPSALASGNLSSALCLHRRHFYAAIGYFGVTEYCAPHRFHNVLKAWKRNNLPDHAIEYHRLHLTMDVDHAMAWLRDVIAPLIDANPDAAREIARGVLYRLNSSARHLDDALAAARARAQGIAEGGYAAA